MRVRGCAGTGLLNLPRDCLTHSPCSGKPLGTETVLRVTEAEQEFVFEGVKVRVLQCMLVLNVGLALLL